MDRWVPCIKPCCRASSMAALRWLRDAIARQGRPAAESPGESCEAHLRPRRQSPPAVAAIAIDVASARSRPHDTATGAGVAAPPRTCWAVERRLSPASDQQRGSHIPRTGIVGPLHASLTHMSSSPPARAEGCAPQSRGVRPLEPFGRQASIAGRRVRGRGRFAQTFALVIHEWQPMPSSRLTVGSPGGRVATPGHQALEQAGSWQFSWSRLAARRLERPLTARAGIELMARLEIANGV